jgi:hypothetical protein
MKKASRDNSVGISTGYGLDYWGSAARFSVGAGNVSLLHCVQTGSGTYTVSYPVGAGGSVPGIKTCRGQECVALYLYPEIHLHGLMLSEARGQLYQYSKVQLS